MSEAKQLYDAILQALEPLLPRTIYQEVRRVRTLAWAITGLCLTRRVQLSAWAQLTQGRAHLAASRERRFSRWLHHPGIVPSDWYQPVVQAALSDWPVTQRLYVALDTTTLLPFVLIRACLVYRGRALPLAWRVLRHQSAQVSFADYEPVLRQVHALLPAGQLVTLLADRGFAHERLLHYLRELDFHFRLRLPGNTLVHLRACRVVAVKALCPAVGQARFVQQVALFGTGFGPISLALATPLEHPNNPWCVASSEPTNASTLREYGLRFDIEETFRDDKSGGFQLQSSRLATADALERLLLILSLATLYLTSLGVGVVQANKWRWVDPHWGRGLSYVQLGTRWLRQQAQHDWQAFAPFRLDPAPDPLPLPASQRVIIAEGSEDDLLTAA